MATAKKLTVLHKIKENEGVLFGPFSKYITKQLKCEKWQEVTKLAESLGLMTGKPWQYFRDTVWSNWRKRTLAKQDNAKILGAGGGKKTNYNEMDLLILDILGKGNPSLAGLQGDDNFQAEETVVDQQVQLPTSAVPTDTPSAPSVKDETRNFRKGSRWLMRGPEQQPICQVDEERKRRKLDLEIQHLELLNYKLKLEALELETKLFIPRSEYTKDLPQLASGRK